MSAARIIRPDGTEAPIQPASARDGFTCAELYAAIGCRHIEVVPLYGLGDLPDRYMILDEDGEQNNLEPNPTATMIAIHTKTGARGILGTVVVCPAAMLH